MDAPLPGSGGPGGGASPHIFTVSELTQRIKGKLESEFGAVWVEGEISGFREAQSGHLYFVLKDAQCQLKAVMFKGRLRGVKFKPDNGLQVIARGQITVYEPRGEYQIIVETLEPRGIGALQLAFEQLKARLAAEGLFDEARKRPIPFLPETVGVVTSPSGAAIRDIIHVMRRRFSGVGILLYPARVQGEGAAAEIALGIRELNRRGGVDVIIVGRGGGSLEDLWAFNEEVVARAIHASGIPVISAVGHEIDFTISDFTADLRAPTPSAAAELVVKNRLSLGRELGSLDLRLSGSVESLLERSRTALENLAGRRVLTRPEVLLITRRQRLDEAGQGLTRVVHQRVVEKKYQAERVARRLARFDPRARLAGFRREMISLRHRLGLGVGTGLAARRRGLESLIGHLQALSPLAILGRGYSICRTVPEGRVITDSGQAAPGDALNVILHRGRLDCTVTGRGEPA